MVARSKHRIRSEATSTGRRRQRSTQAPAGRPISAKARVLDALSRPSSKGEASRVRTASSGIATPLTWAPNWLVVCPASSSRKS
jgi:hypothetical protein